MKERKDLTIYRVGWDSSTENFDDLKMAYSLDWDAEMLDKAEADAVMDAYEARIKELEEENAALRNTNHFNNDMLIESIKQLAKEGM